MKKLFSKKVEILVPSQYLNIYTFYEASSSNPDEMKGKPYFSTEGRDQKVYKKIDVDSDKINLKDSKIDKDNYYVMINGTLSDFDKIDNWSAGSQIIKKESDIDQLAKLARLHIEKGNGNRFHYTLITGKDIEEANKGNNDLDSFDSPGSDYVPLPDDGSNDVVYGMDIRKLRGVIPDKVLKILPQTMRRFKIDTPYKLCHLLSQCGHESGGFTKVYENLKYGADRLLEIFGNYFKKGKSEAEEFAGDPEKIGSRVYANRNGNGGEQSKEGYLYRGRGYIQLTGKSNYKDFAKYIGEDVVSNPDLVSDKYPLDSAAFFFERNRIWKYCVDEKDSSILKVSKAVNVGNANSKTIPHGLDDRKNKFIKYFRAIS